MLRNKQHKFMSCSLTSPASLKTSLHSFGMHASSCLLAPPPQQHVFYGPHGKGSKGWRVKDNNENCSVQVTHATLAPVAVPNYNEWRTITLCVPRRKKELDIGKYCYVYSTYENWNYVSWTNSLHSEGQNICGIHQSFNKWGHHSRGW